jgi:hypothetical protein
MSSGRSLESDTIVKILLFKDFDSGLIPSDSGLSESYNGVCTPNKKSVQMTWLCQKCSVCIYSGMCDTIIPKEDTGT